jgi:hypothetical protein
MQTVCGQFLVFIKQRCILCGKTLLIAPTNPHTVDETCHEQVGLIPGKGSTFIHAFMLGLALGSTLPVYLRGLRTLFTGVK